MTAPNAEHPHIVISCPPNPENAKGFDISVQAENVTSEDELVMLLLLVVEKITSISVDSYVLLVDECRRVASRERSESAE